MTNRSIFLKYNANQSCGEHYIRLWFFAGIIKDSCHVIHCGHCWHHHHQHCLPSSPLKAKWIAKQSKAKQGPDSSNKSIWPKCVNATIYYYLWQLEWAMQSWSKTTYTLVGPTFHLLACKCQTYSTGKTARAPEHTFGQLLHCCFGLLLLKTFFLKSIMQINLNMVYTTT